MLGILTLLFILSGAAGLFYESVWSRYLGLFVGHNAYAQVIVLAIFLGGMAVGATLVARWTDRLREPLFGYAMVEAALGLAGLVFHDLYLAVTGWAYTSVFPATAESALLTLVKWGMAALLIMPQSILLGATFPLMSAGALRRLRQNPGRTLSLLYFANSFGAAAGVLVAGFYLLGTAGLPGTVLAASIINFVVAMATIATSKRWPLPAEAAEGRSPAALAAPRAAGALSLVMLRRLLLGTALGTAVASFVYEIAWLRMLALVLSSATHAFELMLSAFILGLALGALWIRSRADGLVHPLRTLALVQLAMGTLALATVPVYFQAFHWTSAAIQTFARTEPGYVGFTIVRYGLCLLVMLPATFCAGVTLPLITRTLLVGGSGERAIGQVYAWNTIGSIVGVVLAGLVLMPLLGLKLLLVAGALLDMAVGVAILFVIGGRALASRRLVLAGAAAWVLVAVVAMVSPAFDRRVLLSGVYRFGTIPAEGSREVLYYKDGRTATVSAERILQTGEVFIATNGKSDGSLPAYWFQPCDAREPKHPLRLDAATQALLPLITLAHQPEARRGVVIGQGTGMSSHLLLGSPRLERLYTVEIEPEMIRASHAFYPANRRNFEDPRSQYIIDDAKSYFAASGQKYDFIFSEPSNPWVSGVAGLFTEEFYARAKHYLNPGGIFAQWIHIYDLDDRLVLTVLAALHRQFSHYEVFLPAASDILIIASDGPGVPPPDWGVLQYPGIAEDFCHQIPFTPAAMEATRLGNRLSLGPLVDRLPEPNSDFFPHLDLGSERTRFLALQASGIFGLSTERFDITGPITGRRTGPAHFTVAPAPDIPRLYDLALGAALRAPAASGGADSLPEDERLRVARYRQHSWRAELAAPEGPPDWRVWLQRMADVERDRFGGTRGYIDESFFADIDRYLDRWQAPDAIRAAVEFRRGTLGWDFGRANRAARPLVALALQRQYWLPPDELRDGAVAAHLALGDPNGAARAFESLAPSSRRPSGDFRTALLSAYIQAAQEERK